MLPDTRSELSMSDPEVSTGVLPAVPAGDAAEGTYPEVVCTTGVGITAADDEAADAAAVLVLFVLLLLFDVFFFELLFFFFFELLFFELLFFFELLVLLEEEAELELMDEDEDPGPT